MSYSSQCSTTGVTNAMVVAILSVICVCDMCVYVFWWVCICGWVYGCIYVCMCEYICIYIYVYVCVYVCVSVWVWMCDWPLSLSSHSSQCSTTGVTKAMGWYL